MRFVLAILAFGLGLQVQTATVKINVGQNGFSFSPESITAALGDQLEFHFFPGGHSVVQGAFDTPCIPSAGGIGFYSGIVNSPSGEAVSKSSIMTLDYPPNNSLAVKNRRLCFALNLILLILSFSTVHRIVGRGWLG
jgi:hypothetical protein